eukprot:jgi/Mesvir1/622/Mv03005-RA.1
MAKGTAKSRRRADSSDGGDSDKDYIPPDSPPRGNKRARHAGSEVGKGPGGRAKDSKTTSLPASSTEKRASASRRAGRTSLAVEATRSAKAPPARTRPAAKDKGKDKEEAAPSKVRRATVSARATASTQEEAVHSVPMPTTAATSVYATARPASALGQGASAVSLACALNSPAVTAIAGSATTQLAANNLSAAVAAANAGAAGQRDRTCVSAAPTERPPPTAAAPRLWWGDDKQQPHTWIPVDYAGHDFVCVPLERESGEYRLWTKQLESFGLEVTAVTRIQNPALWKRYAVEREVMQGKKSGIQGYNRPDLPAFDFHEALLYHCSGEPDHSKICGQGLDLRLAGGGTFGRGIYLTDDPRKAACYRGITNKVYVCVALLGDVLAVPARDTGAPWKTEPEKALEDQRSPADKHFDSLVGRRVEDISSGIERFANEFVLYKQNATCPMYMVEFATTRQKEDSKPTPMRVRGVPDFAWKSKGAQGANVQDPFGIVAGSSGYVDGGNPWDYFLHNFYHDILPDFVQPIMTVPIGRNVTPGAIGAPHQMAVCKGCVWTRNVLAKFPGRRCMKCQAHILEGNNCLAMPCGHINGHVDCCLPLIQTRVMADGVTSQTFTRCEECMQRFGVTVGTQPEYTQVSYMREPGITLAGHGPGAIKITYHIPSGRQDPDGVKPGTSCERTGRVAYLPDSLEGHEVLRWLHQAFQQRLIFSVGKSLTTGQDNVVVWAGIQHKTDLTPNSTFGYPDGTYLMRVIAEMQQAGVVLG